MPNEISDKAPQTGKPQNSDAKEPSSHSETKPGPPDNESISQIRAEPHAVKALMLKPTNTKR